MGRKGWRNGIILSFSSFQWGIARNDWGATASRSPAHGRKGNVLSYMREVAECFKGGKTSTKRERRKNVSKDWWRNEIMEMMNEIKMFICWYAERARQSGFPHNVKCSKIWFHLSFTTAIIPRWVIIRGQVTLIIHITVMDHQLECLGTGVCLFKLWREIETVSGMSLVSKSANCLFKEVWLSWICCRDQKVWCHKALAPRILSLCCVSLWLPHCKMPGTEG